MHEFIKSALNQNTALTQNPNGEKIYPLNTFSTAAFTLCSIFFHPTFKTHHEKHKKARSVSASTTSSNDRDFFPRVSVDDELELELVDRSFEPRVCMFAMANDNMLVFDDDSVKSDSPMESIEKYFKGFFQPFLSEFGMDSSPDLG